MELEQLTQAFSDAIVRWIDIPPGWPGGWRPTLIELDQAHTVRVAEKVATALRGRTVPMKDAVAPGGLPEAEGFYAWWAPANALKQVPVYLHPLEPVRLLYIGIGPGRNPARQRAGSRTSTLRSRVAGQHIAGNTGSSTLKLVLAALLLEERGYRPERRAQKTVLRPADGLDLRRWQESQLRLTWTEFQRPWEGDIEAAVIKLMQPPLNWQHNRGHPFWPQIDAARRRFRSPASAM